MTFFKNCRTELEEDFKFCTECEPPVKHNNRNKEVGESPENQTASSINI